MLNEKKICAKLEEILALFEERRMDYFDRFPEDATELRTPWDELYDMATDDNCLIDRVKTSIEGLLNDIDEFVYDEEV